MDDVQEQIEARNSAIARRVESLYIRSMLLMILVFLGFSVVGGAVGYFFVGNIFGFTGGFFGASFLVILLMVLDIIFDFGHKNQ